MGGHGGKRDGAGRKPGSGKYGESTTAVRIPDSLLSEVEEFIRLKNLKSPGIPLYENGRSKIVSSDLLAENNQYIDLNEAFVTDVEQAFAVRIKDHSMVDANIRRGDILIVDRTIKPLHKHIVVTFIDDVLLVGRLQVKGRKAYIKPENQKAWAVPLSSEQRMDIWGVVSVVTHGVIGSF